MDYLNQEEEKSNFRAAANQTSFGENSEGIASMYPPTLTFDTGVGDESATNSKETDYAADFKRLENDNLNFVSESHIAANLGMFDEENHGKYRVYKNKKSGEPWFVGEFGKPKFEPYQAGYRAIVMPKEVGDKQNYVQIHSAKLQVMTDDGILTVDSGGSVGVNLNKVGFEFNLFNGDFAITTDLLPVGEISGNIYNPPTFDLDAKFQAQLGFVKIDPENWSFEIEISIPGAPLTPALIIKGQLNQPLIKQDMENLITRDFFPFIGQIIDALEN